MDCCCIERAGGGWCKFSQLFQASESTRWASLAKREGPGVGSRTKGFDARVQRDVWFGKNPFCMTVCVCVCVCVCVYVCACVLFKQLLMFKRNLSRLVTSCQGRLKDVNLIGLEIYLTHRIVSKRATLIHLNQLIIFMIWFTERRRCPLSLFWKCINRPYSVGGKKESRTHWGIPGAVRLYNTNSITLR